MSNFADSPDVMDAADDFVNVETDEEGTSTWMEDTLVPALSSAKETGHRSRRRPVGRSILFILYASLFVSFLPFQHANVLVWESPDSGRLDYSNLRNVLMHGPVDFISAALHGLLPCRVFLIKILITSLLFESNVGLSQTVV